PAVATLAAAFLLAVTSGFLGMSILWRRAEFERTRADGQRSQAQAAQARAEFDFQTAIGLVGRLIEFNAGGAEITPQVFRLEDTADLLDRTRRTYLQLARREPDRERFFAQLLLLDARLEYILTRLRRYDELRILLEESIRECQFSVREQPRSVGAWRCQ